MRDWKRVLNKFLERYINEDYFEGAIACGSFVSGNANEFSDIDVHLVLKEGNEWRERGNLTVDDLLVEYFANPVNVYVNELEEDKREMTRHTTNMFARGIIIIDKHGEVKKLQDKAKENLMQDYPDLSDFELLNYQYSCWDCYDELNCIYHEDRDNFHLVYFNLYDKLRYFLARLKKKDTMSVGKIDKLLCDVEFRNKYGISKFYDEYDTEMLKQCMILQEKKDMFEKITRFYNYVMEVSGGFDINKFVLRSEVK